MMFHPAMHQDPVTTLVLALAGGLVGACLHAKPLPETGAGRGFACKHAPTAGQRIRVRYSAVEAARAANT